MTDNKKAAGDGIPQAASNTFYSCNFNLILSSLKVAVYRRLAPWLLFLGRLHD
jgi:hypothetical protein